MKVFGSTGLKDKYYKEGFEDALLWILDIIKENPEWDLEDIKWEVREELKNED